MVGAHTHFRHLSWPTIDVDQLEGRIKQHVLDLITGVHLVSQLVRLSGCLGMPQARIRYVLAWVGCGGVLGDKRHPDCPSL